MDNIKDLERGFITQMKTRKEELNSQISQYDMAISDILHHLENEKCDAVTLVRISKKLKEIREQRRVVKVEKEQVLCLLRLVGTSNIKKYERRTKYHYRTKIMDDIRNIDKTK